uniref:Kinesin-like protein KIF26A/B helical domain-containing protein n=1 Tax=Echeneis naucrates TaxID=173247 RepID=A0A665V347_ECHNA
HLRKIYNTLNTAICFRGKMMPDTSPTKSGSFFPDTWYRKAYEETTRSSTRPTPEGAGSMPSSTGTPSPGSGISSPGSFSGSPGTTSPGIGTGSPGSLGGSPGFGTGSPASGSGSSPGSERGIWCENCNARLAELKRQALKLLIPGPYSSKDPSFSLLLHDKLQVPNSSRRAWNERDSRCDVCTTHLTQLKQEAVRMVLTLDQWDLSPTSSPPALIGRYGSQGPPGPQGVSGGPGVNSLSNNTALQAHQHMNRTNGGVTLYPYQVSYVQKCCAVLDQPQAKCMPERVHVYICVCGEIRSEGQKAMKVF